MNANPLASIHDQIAAVEGCIQTLTSSHTNAFCDG